MPSVDRDLLLAWLHLRAATEHPVVSAIYTGMTTRILRGDFNNFTEEKTAPGSAPTLTRDLNNTPLKTEGGAV